MAPSIFSDKQNQPTNEAIQTALGKTYSYLLSVEEHIRQAAGEVSREWKHYGKAGGWTLKLLTKKRNLLFISPAEGYFRVAFVFSDKAVDQILSGDFPDSIKEELASATKYVEGRGLQIEVHDLETAGLIRKLVSIKLDN